MFIISDDMDEVQNYIWEYTIFLEEVVVVQIYKWVHTIFFSTHSDMNFYIEWSNMVSEWNIENTRIVTELFVKQWELEIG